MEQPLKVLISAYACEPEKGSEQAVGWNWVRQISRFHELWVITRANNRKVIQRALANEPLPNVHWVYFDLSRWASFWKKERRGIHLYYYLWQVGAYFVARKLHRQVGFHLIHHVTFVNYWMPSFLALLPVPFVWGPVGGGESAPVSFWLSYSLRGKVYEAVRHLARSASELNPLLRVTARRAAVGLGTTHETAARLRAVGCRNVRLMSQLGLAGDEISRLGSFPIRQANPFRVVSVGALLHLKGFELGLRAFARLKSRFPASEYWLIGDGPERKRLERVARELHIAEKVTFTGVIPRREVLEKLAECDVLLHPALHESGGWVCLEAMAAGRPVICLDLGGPASQVTKGTGIKVPAISPDQAVAGLASALEELASDPHLRTRLGEAGRERVREQFNWERKGNGLRTLYDELTAANLQRAPGATAVKKGKANSRVLLSAYACEPYKGSEPAVGWNWVRQIARVHEVWVITRANNREPIEQALAKEPLPNVHWIYFDLPYWMRLWKKGQRGLHPYYYLWQLGAYFVARRLHREVRLDLIHHVTFVNYWMPSFLALLPVPFVWGPVGGGESAPHAFWRSFSLRGKVFELLRNLVRRLGEFDPLVRLTARRAVVGLAATPETEERLRALGCRNVSVCSQVGLPQEEIRQLGNFPFRQTNPFRIVSIGNLLHWKGFELGLRAFGLFNKQYPASELWIVGDGPERRRLEKLAAALGIMESVTFWGAMPRCHVLTKLRDCNLLLHPSLHDSGGWVCIEAMAAGLPVVCLDLGGPGLLVTGKTGIKLAALRPNQVVVEMRDALVRLAGDRGLHARFARGGRRRVSHDFSWERKGGELASMYNEVRLRGCVT